MYFIFRKSDKVILYTPETAEQLASEKAACLRNEGGVDEDYLVVEASGPIPFGMVPTLSDGNAVTFVLTPTIVARNAARLTLAAKLQSVITLTPEELQVLGIGA